MITQNYLTISPAYGRDYKNRAEAAKAFEVGKDFVMESLTGGGGTYCSVRDFATGVIVCVRYAKKQKVVVTKVKARST